MARRYSPQPDTIFVGAAEGCDLLILKNQDQKIAAFGSSYTGVYLFMTETQ
jgi:hypothetical protein